MGSQPGVISWPEARGIAAPTNTAHRGSGLKPADLRRLVQLNEDDRVLLVGLAGWIERVVDGLVEQFWTLQLSTSAVTQAIEARAISTGQSTAMVEAELRALQAGYLTDLFRGARQGWDADYQTGRQNLAARLAQIGLPFRWSVASYWVWRQLLAAQLRETAGLGGRTGLGLAAVDKALNLDLQILTEGSTEQMLAGPEVILP